MAVGSHFILQHSLSFDSFFDNLIFEWYQKERVDEWMSRMVSKMSMVKDDTNETNINGGGGEYNPDPGGGSDRFATLLTQNLTTR